MSNFKCPMCTDCPDNCPLDTEEDTREYSSDYYKGKLDGAREFAEWLYRRNCFDGWYKFDGNEEVKLTTDEILAEWQKKE